MLKKILFSAGSVSCIAAAVWFVWIAPYYTKRIQPGWSWETNFIGYQTYADPNTGILPEKNFTTIYTHRIGIVPGTYTPESVELLDYYAIFEFPTNRIIFEYPFSAPVDPSSGRHLREEFRDEYFLFPQAVEKKNYTLRLSYLKGIPVAFRQETEIEKLNTYLFAYRGRGEYTESYAGTANFPGITVKPGQEIRCDDDQFLIKLWVEPVTGEIIKIEESCHSGDYIFDVATGERLAAVSRWGAETAGDDVIRRVTKVSAERGRIFLFRYYIPLILSAAGLLFFGLMFFSFKPNKDNYV